MASEASIASYVLLPLRLPAASCHGCHGAGQGPADGVHGSLIRSAAGQARTRLLLASRCQERIVLFTACALCGLARLACEIQEDSNLRQRRGATQRFCCANAIRKTCYACKRRVAQGVRRRCKARPRPEHQACSAADVVIAERSNGGIVCTAGTT